MDNNNTTIDAGVAGIIIDDNGNNNNNNNTIGQVGDTLKGDGSVTTLLSSTVSSRLTFNDCYIKDDRLRSGSYGTVYTCHHKSDIIPNKSSTADDENNNNNDNNVPIINNYYAVKIMDRAKLKKKDDDAVFREVELLRKCSSLQHVVRVIDFFVETNYLYVVQVYAAGGDVFDRLANRNTYTEADARDLANILLQTINELHELNIVHRDLKPENLLLRTPTDDSSILVADFGFAKQLDFQEQKLQTRCGTPAYVSPEILVGAPYGRTTDLWSIGCIIYMLIAGYPPFQGENHRILFRKIRAGDYCFHDAYWKNVTIEAKQVITNLLTVNPDKRYDAKKACTSGWFTAISSTELRDHNLSATISELKKFKPKEAWKRAFHAIGFAATAPFWKPDAVTFSQQVKAWDEQIITSKATTPTTTKTTPTTTDNSSPSSVLLKTRFSDMYVLEKKIRKGSFATVWECRHKTTNELLACKMIERAGLKPSDDEAVLNEVAIMQSLFGNKYIVQLLDFYEEDDYFYMVMEYMPGGDVFDRIVQFTQYTEKDAHALAVCLLKAVRSIHKAGIAHRDIKPQNLLLIDFEDNATIKVADFGFAKRVHTPESLVTRVGTPTYVAPEVLKNIPHDQRVDLWSVGIVIFVLLVGYPPFMEDNQAVLFQKIRNGDWCFVPEDWKHISDDAKDLIRGLLVVDPKERLTLEEALRSRWITRQGEGAMYDMSSINLAQSLEQLRNRKNRLRSAVLGYIGINAALKAIPSIMKSTTTSSDDKSSSTGGARDNSTDSEPELTTLTTTATSPVDDDSDVDD